MATETPDRALIPTRGRVAPSPNPGGRGAIARPTAPASESRDRRPIGG